LFVLRASVSLCSISRTTFFDSLVKARAEAVSLIAADVTLTDNESLCIEKSWALLTSEKQAADKKSGMAELSEYGLSFSVPLVLTV
jgi:hypothetical protein